jgi:hypothetical protein
MTTTANSDYIIVGSNTLSYNCETKVGPDEYWPHYQLGIQENGDGSLLSGLLDYWEECEESEEEIVVSTPAISVPEWCGECEIGWQLLKKEDEFGGTEYLEVGLISQEDEKSLEAWYRWYDSGFSDEEPEK